MANAAIAATDVAERLAAAGLEPSVAQTAALTRYLNLLERWNRVFNLTGIRRQDELIDRHLVESLALGPLLAGEQVADIGSGAGLPGLPLAICHSECRFTLIESRSKRVNFLRHVIAELGLSNVNVAHSRVQDLTPAAPFATVLARAVAPPAQLLEIARPLTATGSILLLLTSEHLSHEFSHLADEFVVRPVADEPATRLASSIVVLERVARPAN